MSLRQKFSLLACLAGALIAIVSLVGCYTAYTNLTETLESEISSTVDAQGKDLDTWLQSKAVSAEYLANLLGNLGDINRMKNRELLSLTTSDKDILDVTIGLQDKFLFGYNAGDFTGKIDPTVRPWYNDAKEKNALTFTNAYVDGFTKQLIVSAVAPIKVNGQHVGTTCVDITLDVLNDRVRNLKYRGEGDGIIVERTGTLLATTTDRGVENVKQIPGISDHFDEMLSKGSGYFELPEDEKFGKRVFAYTTLNSAGWILGIAVSEDFVFAPIKELLLTYTVLGIIGFVMMVAACMKAASAITSPIVELQDHAVQLAKGNLHVSDINVGSNDELGALSGAFNDMRDSLHSLIGKVSDTSHRLSESSEALTTNAQQSADTATHIAENVNEVSDNMSRQLTDIAGAKENVNMVFGDIEKMAGQTTQVAQTSKETADAAMLGSKLMESAVEKMQHIETSVMSSAEVVKQLGESSKQIGQILEAIASIADQTNLLALNAAIEAARAGEQGRGFAVVAEEVRKLATASQESAEQIRERIVNIQNDTARAVEAMETGTKDVEEGTAAIREVGEQFQGILQRVEGIRRQMDDIGVSMHEVADGASKIVTSINSIDEVSKKTSEYTHTISSATELQSASNEEIAAASQELSDLAVEMQAAVDRFKM